MSWNYRLMAHTLNGDVFFDMHEVYYNKKGRPNSYTEKGVSAGGEDLEGIYETLELMKLALKKPIIHAGDKFPQIYTHED